MGGMKCKGALLIDCCETCMKAEVNPLHFDIQAVKCKGCEAQQLSAAAAESHGACTWSGTEFRCQNTGHCQLGDAEKSCYELDWQCDIVPCDKCTDDNLKAQCCSDCLGRMCSGTQSQMYCKGCEGGPSSWPFGLKNPFR